MNIWSQMEPLFLNPAITFAAGVLFTKLVEYMLDRYKDRKKMRLKALPLDSALVDSTLIARISVRNIGAKELGILKFGYMCRNGFLYEQIHKDVSVPPRPLKPEEPSMNLIFHDGLKYVPVQKDKVLYFFVETGSKIFYLYTEWWPLGWIKRKIMKLEVK